MKPLLDFRCYHYAIGEGCDPHGIELQVKATKTTLEKVLKDIVFFHKIENPTRVIQNVMIAGQVIADRNGKNLEVVAKFKEDYLFATVFERCQGIKEELTVGVNFSSYVFVPQKTSCCGCAIS